MFFSRISFKADVSPDKGWIIQNLYQSHRTLWRLFPGHDGQNRSYLFREIDSINDQLQFYLVSPDKPVDKDGYWHIETKPYQPMLSENEELAFSLRVNPVVTKTNPETGRKSRHDVVMNQKLEWKAKHGSNPHGSDLQQLIHDAGYEWLSNRSEKNGFILSHEKLVVSSYLQHQLNKKKGKTDFSRSPDKTGSGKSINIKFSTLDFEGLLKIADPERFRNCMFQGIGPAKSFGCGLILVKRHF